MQTISGAARHLDCRFCGTSGCTADESPQCMHAENVRPTILILGFHYMNETETAWEIRVDKADC